MKVSKTLSEACDRLRSCVRFESACLRLPTSKFPDSDTPEIREATRLYIETWVVPIIDAIQEGDLDKMRRFTF